MRVVHFSDRQPFKEAFKTVTLRANLPQRPANDYRHYYRQAITGYKTARTTHNDPSATYQHHINSTQPNILEQALPGAVKYLTMRPRIKSSHSSTSSAQGSVVYQRR
jgi:hypothetical protein